jgi:hypothetical protein
MHARRGTPASRSRCLRLVVPLLTLGPNKLRLPADADQDRGAGPLKRGDNRFGLEGRDIQPCSAGDAVQFHIHHVVRADLLFPGAHSPPFLGNALPQAGHFAPMPLCVHRGFHPSAILLTTLYVHRCEKFGRGKPSSETWARAVPSKETCSCFPCSLAPSVPGTAFPKADWITVSSRSVLKGLVT